jgi:hypothetical protein
MANSNILEIVNGISLAASNAHDGALDENDEPIKIGLKREEGNPIIDSRVMDGFKVSIQNNYLILRYHSEILLKDVHANDFENDISSKLNDIAKFLKSEYKKITGSALTLTEEKDSFKVMVQSISKIRSWVQACKKYKIGGLDEIDFSRPDAEGDKLEAAVRSWLELGKNPKKPENVSIKPSDNEKK